ncbi:hypothetical protein B0A52_07797 [Exophiala mesophila]|uniref:DNA-directed RNA polymerase III subunit RPC9 n=1 Tax=Exophiala mesophila TaxID=212818 RepID=A0A438MXK4_EXOME|nr:hypothetical protein B0A52_07797 [Exophiala mesophila]
MKILDPQSAVLSTLEVHQFFKENPPRPRAKKVGSYPAVDLKNYVNIRQDLARYLDTTVPYVADQTSPDVFIKNVVPKLRRLGLTKPEALMLVNLGIGTPKSLLPQGSAPGEDAETDVVNGDDAENLTNEEPADEEMEDADPHTSYDRQLVPILVEEFEERFPGDQSEQTVEEILNTIRESYDQAMASTTTRNGSGTNGT